METIYACGGRLDLAITLPDDRATRKSGRIYLDEFCRTHRVPLVKTAHINDAAAVAAVRDHKIDWLFVIGWSQIAGKDLLAAPGRGVLGMHPTLLPQGRGRAAIPWAILKRLPKTGVTLFKMSEGVDTGPIVGQQEIELDPHVDATWLYAKVDAAHATLMADVWPRLLHDNLNIKPQDESLASEWPGRKPEDGKIDLTGSVSDAECLVRAVTRPYPGAFVEKPGGHQIIWKARVVNSGSGNEFIQFSDGVLECIETEWQPATPSK
jgi:methionyl-tRNA formyltransferase